MTFKSFVLVVNTVAAIIVFSLSYHRRYYLLHRFLSMVSSHSGLEERDQAAAVSVSPHVVSSFRWGSCVFCFRCVGVYRKTVLVVDDRYTIRDNDVLSDCDNDEQLPAHAVLIVTRCSDVRGGEAVPYR